MYSDNEGNRFPHSGINCRLETSQPMIVQSTHFNTKDISERIRRLTEYYKQNIHGLHKETENNDFESVIEEALQIQQLNNKATLSDLANQVLVSNRHIRKSNQNFVMNLSKNSFFSYFFVFLGGIFFIIIIFVAFICCKSQKNSKSAQKCKSQLGEFSNVLDNVLTKVNEVTDF